ncbi:hypothetical protein NliqN6_4648 [Naganishia liquefaciens]|uniref:Uncharacterized protein n=1 Tax=Naganishia liquefaciens TaxID=104408 RepID=A0A8H3TVC8_9TREE|nr:hypothetical protein NliqN6_4648 [Naganishia liquefaciens]
MPPIRHRDLRVPLAAFTMVFILGSFIHSSIGHAKIGAAQQKAVHYEQALERRKHLGMDAGDQRAERERVRRERGWASRAEAEAEAEAQANTSRVGQAEHKV